MVRGGRYKGGGILRDRVVGEGVLGVKPGDSTSFLCIIPQREEEGLGVLDCDDAGGREDYHEFRLGTVLI